MPILFSWARGFSDLWNDISVMVSSSCPDNALVVSSAPDLTIFLCLSGPLLSERWLTGRPEIITFYILKTIFNVSSMYRIAKLVRFRI